MQNITKKQMYLLGFLVIISIMFYVFYVAYSNRTITLSAQPMRLPQPLNIAVEDSDNVIFSNGRYFVRYQLSSNKTTPLGDDLNLPLPTVSDVSISHNSRYILFKSIDQGVDDILGKTLSEDSSVNTFGETDWWWVYDTKTKQYQSIDARDKKNWIEMGGDELMSENPPRNITARLSPNSDDVYVLFDHSDESRKIAKLNISSGKIEKTVGVDKWVEKFYTYNNSFILLVRGDIIVTDTSGKAKKTITGPYSNIKNDGSGKTPKVLAYKSDRKISDTSFLVVDTSSGKKHSYSSATPESGQVLSDDGNSVAYSKDEMPVIIEGGLVNKKYSIRVPGEDIVVESLDIISIVSKEKIIAIDSDSGIYYLLTKDGVVFQNIPQTVFSIDDTSCDQCTLEYFPDDAYFIASIHGEYSDEKKQIIYNTLKKHGVDVDRVNIKFSFFLYPKGGN